MHRTVLFWIMLCGWEGWLQAQSSEGTSDYVVDAWQTDAGLPDNVVTAILQGRDGYLWLGTANGLARFDGVRFATFRTLDNLGLRSNRINCLREDRDGALWIGTDGGGLSRYRNGQFASWTTAEGLSSDNVLCLENGNRETLWAGTDSGLNRYAGGQWAAYFKIDGLPNDHIQAIGRGAQSPLLFATSSGLCQYSGGRLSALETRLPPGANSGFHCVLRALSGAVWVGGEKGLFRLPPDVSNGAPAVVSREPVTVMIERTGGEIWFGCANGNLECVLPVATSPPVKLAWRFHGTVTALSEDSEGNLWVGTAGDGLHRVKQRQLSWVSAPAELEARWPPAFFERPEGQLQFVAADGQLYRCLGERLIFAGRLPLPEGVAVRTACVTPQGELWLGTVGDGIFRCHPTEVQQFSEQEGLSDSAIGALCPGEDGSLWIGTCNGGLNRLHNGRVARYNTPWGFSGNYPCALAEDGKHNLWIGTTGDGLFCLTAGRFVGYTSANGLPSQDIRALFAAANGDLWVGTAKGLCCVKEERIITFSGAKGLPNEAILQLRSSRDGTLWVGSSSGIFRMCGDQAPDRAKGWDNLLDAIRYGREDGLPGFQCVPTCQSPAPGGGSGIWFCTTKGLVVGEPRGLKWNRQPPPVILEQVLVDNNSVPITGALRVPPGKEDLQFQYTALSFTAPAKINFRYKLEGYDAGWSQPGPGRTARYPQVPPGSYRFRVTACNNDGVWNETGAGLNIVVVPFWWATLWFRTALVSVAIALLVSFYRVRQARRRDLNRLRVRIATDLHDEIGSSLWSIILLSRMLAKHGALGADERQDINEIHRIATQSSNAIRDLIWLINPALDSLQDLVLRMNDFTGIMLRGAECHLHYEGVDLTKKLPLDLRQNLFLFFKEAITNIAKHSQATTVDIQLDDRPPLCRLCIRDNGKGFDPAAVTAGNGLANMRSRARKMGGDLKIQAWPGRGACLTLDIPWP